MLKTYLQTLFKLTHTQAHPDFSKKVQASLPVELGNSTIVAPFGGYFTLNCVTRKEAQQLRIVIDGVTMSSSYIRYSKGQLRAFAPVNKGSSVQVSTYGYDPVTRETAWFIPLVGRDS